MEVSERKWNCGVKKRIVILCGIIYILTLSMGCSTNQNDAEERLKQERFQGVEEVATDQQINMYFAYKDIEMKEYNSFQFRMNFTSDTYPDSHLALKMEKWGSESRLLEIINGKWEIYILNRIKQCINPLKIRMAILRKKVF